MARLCHVEEGPGVQVWLRGDLQATFSEEGMCDRSDVAHLCPGLWNVSRAESRCIPNLECTGVVQEALAARRIIGTWVDRPLLNRESGIRATPQLMQTIEPST
jgi:hypothetical protein